MSDAPSVDSASRLERLERELVRCIGGALDFRLTVSDQDDNLDAVATGINVLLDEVEYAMVEAAARREAQAALQNQALLFETIQDGVSVIGPDGKVTAWNPSARVLFGLSAEEVLGGRSFPMLTADEAAALDTEVVASLATERVWHGEVIVERSEGERCICETTIVPVKASGGQSLGRVQIFRDVTEARTLEQRLQHAERLKSLGLLAGGVAHDFNNQLTGIQSAAEVLRRLLGQDIEHLSPYVDTILLASQRAAILTEQLLAFARRGPMRLEPVSMNDVVREMVDLLKRSVDKRIEVRLDTA
ncbi:MAG: PAS domain-containing protein, partial [Myxococcota bacterium]|nr:PAS domain-containing protein [Myxococcota bacterium]